jgi:hypothetical protein
MHYGVVFAPQEIGWSAASAFGGSVILCLPTVFDIRAGGVPLYDLAALVTQRFGADEKPAKYSVVPTKARLDLPRFS